MKRDVETKQFLTGEIKLYTKGLYLQKKKIKEIVMSLEREKGRKKESQLREFFFPFPLFFFFSIGAFTDNLNFPVSIFIIIHQFIKKKTKPEINNFLAFFWLVLLLS